MRFLNDSKYVITILLLIMIIFSILLYLDFTRKNRRGNNEVIGHVTYKKKSVRKKEESSVMWHQVEMNEPLTMRDTILSEDLSDAVLHLKDGAEIKLDQNSMIVIDFSGSNFNINFLKGSVQIDNSKGTSNINVQSGDQIVSINDSDTKLEKKGDDDLMNLHVNKGSVRVKTQTDVQTVNANEISNIRQNKINISKNSLKLIEPEDFKFYFAQNNKQNITFKWDANLNVTLEISKNTKFTKNIMSKNIATNQTTVELNEGTYYWRISELQSGQRVYSPHRKINVVTQSNFSLYLPNKNAKYNYVDRPPTISFSWKKIEFANGYVLQVSKDVNFSNSIKSIRTYDNNLTLMDLDSGEYYYRVQTISNNKDYTPQTSETRNFSIVRSEIYNPPVLVFNNNTKLSIDDMSQKGLNLRWNVDQPATLYKVEVSTNSSFTNLLVNISTQLNYYKLKENFQAGTYYWRVKPVYGTKETAYSKVSQFVVQRDMKLEIVYPVNQSEIELDKKNRVRFRWNQIESATYLLELSKTLDFANIVVSTKTTNNFSSEKNLLPGDYYVRVKQIEPNGNLISQSSVVQFKIAFKLVPPVAIAPINNVGVEFDMNKDGLKFSWEPLNNAQSYTIQIFSSNNQLVHQSIIKNTQITIKNLGKVQLDKYRWTISASVSNKNGEIVQTPISEYSFRITGIEEKIDVPEFKDNKTLYNED